MESNSNYILVRKHVYECLMQAVERLSVSQDRLLTADEASALNVAWGQAYLNPPMQAINCPKCGNITA